jgi:hypothetical protein
MFHLLTRAALPAQQSQRIVVQPYLSGLDPGIYHGTLTLSFSGGVTRAVSLLFVVTGSPASSVSSAKPGRHAPAIAHLLSSPPFSLRLPTPSP